MEKNLEDLNELERKIQEIAFVDSEKYVDFKTKIDEIRESLTSSDLVTSTMQIGYLEAEIDQYLSIGNLKPNLILDSSDQIETGEEAIRNHKVKLFVEASDTVRRSEFKNIDKVVQLRNLWEIDKQKRNYNQAQIAIVEESFANMIIAYQSWYYTQNGELPELDVSELCSLESYEHELKERFLERVVEKNTDPETKRKMEILFSSKDLQGLISDESFWRIIAGDKKVLEEVQNTALEQLERENEQTKPAEESSDKPDDYSSPNFPRSSKVVLTLKKKNVFGQEVLVKKKIPVRDGKFMIPRDIDFKRSIIEVEIPEGVISIDGKGDLKAKKDMSFEGCCNLKKVMLPSSLKRIGRYAFERCSGLEKIDFPEGLECIDEGAFNACKSLEKVNLPSGIKRIEKFTFAGCTNLRKVKFPEELEYIGEDAFSRCGCLRKIAIPNNVKVIREEAFYKVYPSEVILPNKLERIELKAFADSRIGSISFSDSLLYIGNYAFSGTDLPEELTIPENVAYIGEGAFYECSKLKKVKILGNANIKKFAFLHCKNLKKVTVTKESKIAPYAFESDNEVKIEKTKSKKDKKKKEKSKQELMVDDQEVED